MSLPKKDSTILMVPEKMNSQDQRLPPTADEQRSLADDYNLKVDMDESDKITSLPLSGNVISKQFVPV